MASYPSLPQSLASDEQVLDDINIDRAVNGAVKSRAFYTTRKKVFKIRHHHITAAEKSTLEAFYEANRLITFTITWTDGVVYTCLFSGPIKFSPLAQARWEVESNMVQI